jgi:hypothetical protein
MRKPGKKGRQESRSLVPTLCVGPFLGPSTSGLGAGLSRKRDAERGNEEGRQVSFSIDVCSWFPGSPLPRIPGFLIKGLGFSSIGFFLRELRVLSGSEFIHWYHTSLKVCQTNLTKDVKIGMIYQTVGRVNGGIL